MPEITQEELDLLTRYKELGTPDEITGEIEEKQQMAHTTMVVEAAAASGFKFSVLDRLTQGLDLKMQDGKAFIGDKPIEDYANENWQDFLPSLKQEEGDKKVKFVSQSRAATKPANQFKNVAVNYIKNTYAAKAS
jgi:hypothetical protein